MLADLYLKHMMERQANAEDGGVKKTFELVFNILLDLMVRVLLIRLYFADKQEES